MDQSELQGNKCNLRQARENACEKVTLGRKKMNKLRNRPVSSPGLKLSFENMTSLHLVLRIRSAHLEIARETRVFSRSY